MKPDELRERLKRGLKDLQNFLRTEQGKSAIYCLEAKYGGSCMCNGDPYETHRRLGERDVLDYLKDLRDGENIK